MGRKVAKIESIQSKWSAGYSTESKRSSNEGWEAKSKVIAYSVSPIVDDMSALFPLDGLLPVMVLATLVIARIIQRAFIGIRWELWCW